MAIIHYNNKDLSIINFLKPPPLKGPGPKPPAGPGKFYPSTRVQPARRQPAAVVQGLKVLLNDSNPRVARNAAVKLITILTSNPNISKSQRVKLLNKAFRILLKQLEHKSPRVRQAAAIVLHNLGPLNQPLDRSILSNIVDKLAKLAGLRGEKGDSNQLVKKAAYNAYLICHNPNAMP